MHRFLLVQVGRSWSTEASGRARRGGQVGFPDVLGLGAVTAIAGNAEYELLWISPSVLIDPIVTRGGDDP